MTIFLSALLMAFLPSASFAGGGSFLGGGGTSVDGTAIAPASVVTSTMTTNAAYVKNNLTVDSSATVKGASSIEGALGVSGSSIFKTSVTLTGTNRLSLSGPGADSGDIYYSDANGLMYLINTYTGVGASNLYGINFQGGPSTNLMKVTGSGLIVGNGFADLFPVGARLDVVGDAQFGSGVVKATVTTNGYFRPATYTTLQLAPSGAAPAPGATGEIVWNSTIKDTCVSTAAVTGAWALSGSKGATGCF